MEHGPQSIEKDLEEPETDERDQIENPTKSNMRKIQELRADENLVDADTDLEYDHVHDIKEAENTINKDLTTVIAENSQDKKLMTKKKIIICILSTNIIGRPYCYWYIVENY